MMMSKMVRVAVLALLAGSMFGCAYAGIAVAPNGTVYVARNDAFLFGILRGVYACTPAGQELNCTRAGAP